MDETGKLVEELEPPDGVPQENAPVEETELKNCPEVHV